LKAAGGDDGRIADGGGTGDGDRRRRIVGEGDGQRIGALLGVGVATAHGEGAIGVGHEGRGAAEAVAQLMEAL